MFIQKTDINVELDKIIQSLDIILEKTTWHQNQIGLTHRPGADNLWHDSIGSLYNRLDRTEQVRESAFTELNPEIPEYLSFALKQLCDRQGIKIGRARFMKLPSRTGLSVHFDNSERYHLVIKTNKHAFIAHTMYAGVMDAVCFHIPADGHFYKIDTTKEHFVYNGGFEDRVHLVITPK
jgi:hypothetical protein